MNDKYAETKELIDAMSHVKMIMNRHKGAIEDVYVGDLVKMMSDEITELVQALDDNNLMHVIEEASDIMNYLVAIVDQQVTKYRGRKK